MNRSNQIEPFRVLVPSISVFYDKKEIPSICQLLRWMQYRYPVDTFVIVVIETMSIKVDIENDDYRHIDPLRENVSLFWGVTAGRKYKKTQNRVPNRQKKYSSP